MKASELMIGDWVLINGTPRKIQAVDGVDDEIMADDELYTLAEDRYHSEDKVEGAPITAGILEKNGFERSGVFVEWKYEDDNVYMIYKPFPYIKIQMEERIVTFPGKYVHQLQHALRLCGIEKEITI